jgi:hypothetical protein
LLQLAPRETLCAGRGERYTGHKMDRLDVDYDFARYRKLLAEAVDEKKRLALIDLLIEERAKDRLDAQHASEQNALTAMAIARILGASRD